jgi:hypothetical protein
LCLDTQIARIPQLHRALSSDIKVKDTFELLNNNTSN